MVKKHNTTEITTIAESDDISQKGARFIIKTLYTKLLQNPVIKESEPYIQKPDKAKVSIKETIVSNFVMIGFLVIIICIVSFMVFNNSENIDTNTKQEITNINLDDTDNNNVNINNSHSSKISAEDEIKLRQFKDKVQQLFDQLMIFKNEKDFQEVGFAVCCKYNKWMKDVEALVGTPEAELFNTRDYYLVNELGQLGRDYIHLEGRESEYTNWNKKRLIEALKEK